MVRERKGIKELLTSVSQLKRMGIDFKLWVVGDGSLKYDLENYSHKTKINKNVVFTSWLSEMELNTIYEKCQIFILTSWSEGMPNSMIEAMATGCVPVITNVGNISDFINEKTELF